MGRNEQIEAELAQCHEAARAEWPGLNLDRAMFISYVLERVPEGVDLLEVRTGQLYLACACVRGDPLAFTVFERTFRSTIATSIAQLRGLGADRDDVTQLVLQKVLVGDGDRSPKIADFNGSGELRGWLKAVALRTGLNYLRKRKREVVADDEDLWMTLPVEGLAPGLAELRTRFRTHFKAALPRAIAALSHQDRALLRYHYLDGLNLDQVGKIHGVHRTTAARWIERACAQLLDQVRVELRDALGVGDAELDSLVEMIRSQLDLSLTGYFAAAARLS